MRVQNIILFMNIIPKQAVPASIRQPESTIVCKKMLKGSIAINKFPTYNQVTIILYLYNFCLKFSIRYKKYTSNYFRFVFINTV